MSFDPASYVEGVPVKITEKFRPPRKVSLSSSCSYQINTDILTDEYDFVVEHDTLNWLENYKKRREVALNQRQFNIKEYEESKSKIIEEEILKQHKLLEDEKIIIEDEERKLEEERERSIDEGRQERSQSLEIVDELKNDSEMTIDFENKLDNIKLVSEENEIVPVSVVNKEHIGSVYSNCNETTNNQSNFENMKFNLYSQQPYPSVLVPTQCTTQDTHQRSPSKVNSSINFADFEGDASDPFDSVALKSINDMEELAKILQITNNCSDKLFANADGQFVNTNFAHPRQYMNDGYPNSQFTYLNYQQPNNTFTNVPPSYRMEKLHNNITSVPVSLSSDANYNSTFLQQTYSPWKDLSNSCNSGNKDTVQYHFKPNHYSYQISQAVTTPTSSITNNIAKTIVPNCEDNQLNSVTNSLKSVDQTPLSINKRQDLEDFYTRYYSPHKPQISGIRSGENTPTSSLGESRAIRSSSSVPDLSAADDHEVSSIVSSFEPAKVNLKSSVSNPPSRPSSAVGIESYKVHCKQNALPSTTKFRLHDPFIELTSDAQTLVQNLAEMGFPRPRVARAVQKLGTDHKKLLEVLLTLQSFQESGEDEYRSENAFYFYMGDVTKVQDFLTASKTLLDLGFDEEEIISNLFKHQNDKDKCLEELIS